MLKTLGEPEDELVVHQVRERVPSFSQKMGSPDRESSILSFDLSPVRFHHCKIANSDFGVENQ
jgi:hypothetical protein